MGERPPAGDEFSLLVDDVRRREAQRRAQVPPEAVARDERHLRLSWLLLAWSVLAVLVFMAVPAAGPGAAQVRADLLHLLERSRASVESSLLREGHLPGVLPDPALARLVDYAAGPAAGAYELRATLVGQTIVWRSQEPARFEEFRQ